MDRAAIALSASAAVSSRAESDSTAGLPCVPAIVSWASDSHVVMKPVKKTGENLAVPANARRLDGCHAGGLVHYRASYLRARQHVVAGLARAFQRVPSSAINELDRQLAFDARHIQQGKIARAWLSSPVHVRSEQSVLGVLR